MKLLQPALDHLEAAAHAFEYRESASELCSHLFGSEMLNKQERRADGSTRPEVWSSQEKLTLQVLTGTYLLF